MCRDGRTLTGMVLYIEDPYLMAYWFNQCIHFIYVSMYIKLCLSLSVPWAYNFFFFTILQHIDSLLFLQQKCVWKWPKTFPVKALIGDTIFVQWVENRLSEWQKNLASFRWAAEVMKFVKWREDKYLQSWKDIDFVYFVKKVNNWHGMLCGVNLNSWKIFAYDSDHSVHTDKQIQSNLLPMCKLLLHNI